MPVGGGAAAAGLPKPPVDIEASVVLDGVVGNEPSCQFIKKRQLGHGCFASAWKVEEVATGVTYAANQGAPAGHALLP